MPPEAILNRAAIPVEDLGQANHELNQLANLPFVNRTDRGLAIDTGMQEQIADFPFYRCDYRKEQIKTRLKHYDNWERHDWAPSYW